MTLFISFFHAVQMQGKEVAFTAQLKIHSLSQIFKYGRSILCRPHWPKFSYSFDLCLHWVSVVSLEMKIPSEIFTPLLLGSSTSSAQTKLLLKAKLVQVWLIRVMQSTWHSAEMSTADFNFIRPRCVALGFNYLFSWLPWYHLHM